MARSAKQNSAKPERRPRSEIDRNYFFGDVLIKSGAATGLALALIAAYTPFTMAEAIANGDFQYLFVMGGFGALAAVMFLYGRHLRRQATHWDFD